MCEKDYRSLIYDADAQSGFYLSVGGNLNLQFMET